MNELKRDIANPISHILENKPSRRYFSQFSSIKRSRLFDSYRRQGFSFTLFTVVLIVSTLIWILKFAMSGLAKSEILAGVILYFLGHFLFGLFILSFHMVENDRIFIKSKDYFLPFISLIEGTYIIFGTISFSLLFASSKVYQSSSGSQNVFFAVMVISPFVYWVISSSPAVVPPYLSIFISLTFALSFTDDPFERSIIALVHILIGAALAHVILLERNRFINPNNGDLDSVFETDKYQAQVLQQIISNVSHDLLSPLQALEMGLESLQDIMFQNIDIKESRELNRRSLEDNRVVRENTMKQYSEDNASPLSHQVTVWRDLSSRVIIKDPPSPGTGTRVTREDRYITPQQELVQTMRSTLSFMAMIIDRSLDASKSAGGVKLIPTVEKFDAKESVVKVIRCVEGIQTSGVFKVTYDPELTQYVISTDRRWFEGNLLCVVSNAVKYSKFLNQHPIEVKVSLSNRKHSGKFPHSTESTSVFLRVDVTDSGEELSEDQLVRFFRAADPTERSAVGGMGLGLYTLAQRIEALDGEYSVRQRLDNKCSGAVVSFAFPIEDKESMVLIYDKIDASNCRKVSEVSSSLSTPKKRDILTSIFSSGLQSPHTESVQHPKLHFTQTSFAINIEHTDEQVEMQTVSSKTVGGTEHGLRKPINLETSQSRNFINLNNFDTTMETSMQGNLFNSQTLWVNRDFKLRSDSLESLSPETNATSVNRWSPARINDSQDPTGSPRTKDDDKLIFRRHHGSNSGYDVSDHLIQSVNEKLERHRSRRGSGSSSYLSECAHRNIPKPLTVHFPSKNENQINLNIQGNDADLSYAASSSKLALSIPESGSSVTTSLNQSITSSVHQSILGQMNSISLHERGTLFVPVSPKPLPSQSSPSSPARKRPSSINEPNIAPLAIQHPIVTPSSSSKSVQHRSVRLSVLVVDDSLPIVKMTQMNLEKAGHVVDCAKNGRLALDMMFERLYDVVLMDIQMPVMGGIEAVRHFRKHEEKALNYIYRSGKGKPEPSPRENLTPRLLTPRLRRQFIIGMSANGEIGTREEALGCGMDAFLAKPFSLDAIMNVVKENVDLSDGTVLGADNSGPL
jgi:CheY-like chemotaxis protein/signal transduction histidine kinase